MRDLVKKNVKKQNIKTCTSLSDVQKYALEYYRMHQRFFNARGIDSTGLLRRVNARYNKPDVRISVTPGYSGINLGRLVTFKDAADSFYKVRLDIIDNENK
jgi:hypothetical protein